MTSAEPSEDVFDLVGSIVAGTFEVDRVVAQGGFAVVYRARHLGFRAPVALKCLNIPQHFKASMQERFREQFRTEAEILFRLSARIPAIVRPLHIDAVESPNGRFMPFLALEWLEGQTLDAYASERIASTGSVGTLPELVRLFDPVARALARAHHFETDAGEVAVAHRDIKPENLFLASVAGEQTMKILDYGIAKTKSVVEQIAGSLSIDGSRAVSFTPAYGAPEQWAPTTYGQSGPWTDVWGLALTFCEMLAGRPVLDGDAAAVMGSVIDTTRRPTPRNSGVAVSDAVEAVFARALAVDPRDRYADVGDFWSQLCDAAGNAASSETVFARAPVSERSQSSGPREFEISGSSPPLELASIPPPNLTPPRTVAHSATGNRGGHAAEPATTKPTESQRPAPDVPLWKRCRAPLLAIAVGLGLSTVGEYYARVEGEVFSLGPVGVGWVTIPLVLGGSLLLVHRMLRGGRVRS